MPSFFQEVAPYSLVFSRWLSFLLVLPGIGEHFVSARIRLLLALSVSACVTPCIISQKLLIENLSPGFFLQELLIGGFLGMLVRLFIDMVSTAGHIMSHEMSLTNLVIPLFQEETQDLIHAFLKLYFTTFVFVTDLHLTFFKGVYKSYDFFPAGQALLMGDMTEVVVEWITKGLVIAVQMSSPFLIWGLCYYVFLGLVSRLVPQIPFFFVARPLEIGMGFVMLMLGVMALAVSFHEHVLDMFGGFLEF